MTLVEHDVQQGTSEWLELRRGVVTASTIGRLIGTRPKPATDIPCPDPDCAALRFDPCIGKRGKPVLTVHTVRSEAAKAANGTPDLMVADTAESRSAVASLVAERVTGFIEPTFITRDMWRGTFDEPFARDVYAEHYAPVRETGFYTEDKWGFTIGFSPDGVVGDHGLIEIKSRLAKIQLRTIVNDEVPTEVMPQLQTGLLVTGRQWIDYVSFCGGMPLYVKRVFPDPRWQQAIVEAVRQLEQAAADITTAYRNAIIGSPMTERMDMEMVI